MTRQPWTRFVGVGLQLAAAILIGLYVGYRADARFGTSPWGLLGGTVVGAAAGFYSFIKEALRKEG